MIVTDKVPPSIKRNYRTRGIVHVTLRDGTAAEGPAFKMSRRDAWPSGHVTQDTLLNGLPYGFRCSSNRKGRGTYPVSCAYFRHGMDVLFFYTAGDVLQDGARVVFVEHAA